MPFQRTVFGASDRSIRCPSGSRTWNTLALHRAGVGRQGGGARRNIESEVLDHHGKPIPRLYEAGELGSMFSNLYQNGSYLTEAMISGRAAGRNAVRLRPVEAIA